MRNIMTPLRQQFEESNQGLELGQQDGQYVNEATQAAWDKFANKENAKQIKKDQKRKA